MTSAAPWELASHLDELQRTGPAAAVLAEAAWLAGGDQGLRDPALRELLMPIRGQALKVGWRGTVAQLGYWLAKAGIDNTVAFPEHPYGLQALGQWRAAAQRWQEAGHPYAQAVALLDSGRSEHCLAALTILDGIGAAPLAARTRRNLRNRGVAHVPRGPSTTTRANPGGLTARQAEVLELLRLGLCNVPSRIEAAALLLET